MTRYQPAMVVAVLLRGMHRCDGHVHGTTGRMLLLRYEKTRDALREYAIDALRASGHEVHVYISSYTSPVQTEVVRFFGARCARFADPTMPLSSQSRCMQDGLSLIPDGVYASILVVRFDLALMRPLSYLLDVDTTAVTLLWREKPDGKLVADCIHVIPGEARAAFAASLDECPVKRDMHHVLPYMLSRALSVRYAYPDQCYDSNSDNEPNPVYRISRTPALQAAVPSSF